jgi:hypothetical protein
VLFEFRHYTCKPGQRDDWVKYMEEVVIPFQVSCGMVILGSFTSDEDPNAYYWLRRFKDEDERKRLYEAVYQSDTWKNDIGPKVPAMIDREAIKVTRLNPTPKSVIQ